MVCDKNTKAIKESLWARVNDTYQDTKLEAILDVAIRKEYKIKEIIIREIEFGEYGSLLYKAIETIGYKDFFHTERIVLLQAKKTKELIPNG